MVVWAYVLAAVLAVLFISGCTTTSPPAGAGSTSQLSEFQQTACRSADNAGTCATRLAELNIVTTQQCCASMGLCC